MAERTIWLGRWALAHNDFFGDYFYRPFLDRGRQRVRIRRLSARPSERPLRAKGRK